jgi:transposase
VDHIFVSFDEASFRLVPVYRKVWFIRGKKPQGVFFWSNKKLCVFGALTSEHSFHYEFYPAQNSFTFVMFLSSLLDKLDQNKRYVFILDNVGFHKTDVVKNFIDKYYKNVKVVYLPPYSPELNPIETCWKITRAAITNSTFFLTLDEMQDSLEAFWNRNPFMLKITNYLCR